MAEIGGKMPAKPVAIIMGSQSDWATMKYAAETLDALAIPYDAHRLRPPHAQAPL
jgi:5-(carboxyamino)imidazole ribonucleotide mutase